MNMIKIFMCLGSYIAGSIPFGIIIAWIMGTGDIRKKGSGNIGATNVFRTTGKSGGAMTLLLDALKGLIPVLIAKSLWGVDIWTLAVAFAAIIGHNYTMFLRFKGGKGVATSLGVLLALWPYIGLITIGIWIGSMFIWRYSSLAALISFGILPAVTAIGEKYLPFIIFSVIISTLLYFRHIENIRRLIAGQEIKIGKGSGKTVVILLTILLSANSALADTVTGYDRFIPVEIEKLWKERQTALAAGNAKSSDHLLEEIVRTKYKLGIKRIDDVSALVVREGYLTLEKGRPEDAHRLSVIAKEISQDYAPSYYLAARSLGKMSKASIGEITSEYLGGIKASVRDFRTLFNYTGRLYTIILLAISLSFLAFIIALCCRHFPLFLHTFNEITAGFINRPFNIIFFFIIAFFPLLFGIVWFVLFWIVITWIYLSKKEKIFAVIFILFFLFLPKTLKYTSIYITAHNNVTLKGLLAVNRGYGEPSLIEELKDQLRMEPGNYYIPLSIAYLANKEGRTEESRYYYENLLNSNQKSIRINANNSLGNIYFSMGNFDKAIGYYMDTIKESPESPIPVYNLGQAYREKLLFTEAEKSYEAAKKINLHDVERFTALSAKGSGYRVIDYPLNVQDMWYVALSPSEDAVTLVIRILNALIRIPAERFPFLGISIGIILSVLSYIKPVTPMAYYCPGCNRTVCGRCTGSRIFGTICRNCRMKGQESQEPAGKFNQIYFLVPGLWHMFRGQIGKGIILSMIFCIGLSGLITRKAGSTWTTAYYLPEWPPLLWISLIFLSYVLLFFTGIRPYLTELKAMRRER
ncbi:MAG: glycerol-3-phosphate 1-O-acyltransferase PlsY [Nitrospirota bacterium]